MSNDALDETYHAARSIIEKARPETIEELIRNGHREQPWTREDVALLGCGCRPHPSGNGDIPCHVCGEYVNVRCWNCRTPRGEGKCPNPKGG